MPRPPADLPPLYAMVQPGLEPVAADEITRDVGGSVVRSGKGIVVFRAPRIGPELLNLRTTEDVYLLAWGTDALTFRATDLQKIQQWTAREPDWPRLLQLHHGVHPKPKGKPTFHLVVQMQGDHCYFRRDAKKSLLAGLAGHFPASWREVEDDAAIEVWLTANGRQAVCGLRLSDKRMRHRDYKSEHLPASLRPTVAAAMVRLAGTAPGMTVLDPMCGAGTILAEQLALARQRGMGEVHVLGGDLDRAAVEAARVNLRKVGPQHRIARWDARRLPLPRASVDRIVCNPPFGKQLLTLQEVIPLYRRLAGECDRVLKPGGRAVILTSEPAAFAGPAERAGWQSQRQLAVRVLGQLATLGVWRKPMAADTIGEV